MTLVVFCDFFTEIVVLLKHPTVHTYPEFVLDVLAEPVLNIF